VKTLKVSAERTYNVTVDCNWLNQLTPSLTARTRVAIVHSVAMRDRFKGLESIDSDIHFFEVADGESAKSPKVLQSLWDWLGAAGFTRSDLIIGIGGGTITDLAGFAAATWLRGIDWIAVPTTLAGMVDASIGGKTGINSDYGKNLIGSFHSPIEVIIDIEWLKSLSDRDFAAGLAEVVKTGFIADGDILDLLEGKSVATVRSDAQLVVELIHRSVAVKAKVVSGDFRESFDREILNYGHTLGHAIEIHSKYELRHGEAVAIGLVFAAQLAGVKNVLDPKTIEKHVQILSAMSLPVTYPRSAWDKLYPLLSLDKKSRGNTLRFVAISEVGKTLRIEDANESELTLAYERICT